MARPIIGSDGPLAAPRWPKEGEPVIFLPRVLPLLGISQQCDSNNSGQKYSYVFCVFDCCFTKRSIVKLIRTFNGSIRVRYSSWGLPSSILSNMLTDMTPTAGQFYGAQIPAMTMNMKAVSNIIYITGFNFLWHRMIYSRHPPILIPKPIKYAP